VPSRLDPQASTSLPDPLDRPDSETASALFLLDFQAHVRLTP